MPANTFWRLADEVARGEPPGQIDALAPWTKVAKEG